MNAYKNLYKLKCNSTDKFDNQCELSHLTLTQVEYLKIIDRHEYITISQLASEVQNSKPTVTEMVKKFTALDCVYKVKCHQDGRKAYLKLTDRGLKIARMEENVLQDLISKIMVKLTEDEVETLISLFEKLGSDD
jgi:DNA-binding MarR family transcriptional regulator